MAEDNFIDYVKINFRSGAGGKGSVSFMRDKMNPKGGPDGGDGGRGGHIILRGNKQLWTLLHLKFRKHIIAENGAPGGSSRSTGKSGEDVILDVPLGTIAKDPDTGDIILEITEDGEERILAAGGRGGLGNFHFKNSVNQNPKHAQPGEAGEDTWKILELKLLADVGLVGFPNAGKSTLLASISAATPKVADYAFTTLTPNLGVVQYRNYKSFVMADIPGIIEGAHEGKGLGLRFLRHIERNAVLLFTIPADTANIKEEYQVLLNELAKYNPDLVYKDRMLAITKADMIDEDLKKMLEPELPKVPLVFISSVTGEGLSKLKDMLWDMLNRTEY